MRFSVDSSAPTQKFKRNLAGLKDRIDNAMVAAANMAASMIEDEARADIAAGGNFGSRWTEGLHVTVTPGTRNMQISMTHDIEYAGIFETGGKISGKPLMWIGITGTDADRVPVSQYGDQLFSAKSARGTPLLFSVSDHQPKYFGIATVDMPPKWHLTDIQLRVMQNFRALFDTAFRAG